MTSDGTRLDPHVKVLDDRVVRRAKRHGLDVVVYAPHFRRLPSIQEAAAAYTDDELTVLPARELFTGTWRRRRHVLAIGLEEPVPDFLPLATAIEECRRQDATILVPHPTFMTVSLTASEVATHRSAIDALEVYNPKFLPHHTRRARRLAGETALPAFASSYAHLRGTVGDVWTTVQADVEDVPGLQDAIADGDLGSVGRRTGLGHAARRATEFAHLGWENSWTKVDRVLLGGTEATHPRHPAYDGRFDDVAVY